VAYKIKKESNTRRKFKTKEKPNQLEGIGTYGMD